MCLAAPRSACNGSSRDSASVLMPMWQPLERRFRNLWTLIICGSRKFSASAMAKQRQNIVLAIDCLPLYKCCNVLPKFVAYQILATFVGWESRYLVFSCSTLIAVCTAKLNNFSRLFIDYNVEVTTLEALCIARTRSATYARDDIEDFSMHCNYHRTPQTSIYSP